MNDAAIQYDVVIAGAGITGAILANKLSQEGFRVLILDAGARLFFDPTTGSDQRQELLDTFYGATARVPNAPYPNLKYAPMPFVNELGQYYYGPSYQKQAPPAVPPKPDGGVYSEFNSTYTRIVGGTTYHWLGTSLRYVPSTFKEQSTYGHSTDWPITYETLEDWYWRAENEIGVSGDSNLDLGAPRHGKPYPMPLILPSYTDRVMAERLQGLTFEGLPVQVAPTPQGRNSTPFQDRPPCAGSTNCVPICPIQAKYDATVHLKRAMNPALDPENKPGSKPVEHRWRAVVTKVEVDDEGKVSGLAYRSYTESGHLQDHTVTAHIYILATHAVEIPKILLYSATDRPKLQNGVANSSGLVGRYLMDHKVRIAYGMADVPLYPFRGPLSTSGIESLRDGAFRRERSAFRIEIEAIGANWALNAPFGVLNDKLNDNVIGQQLWQEVGWDVNRQVQLDALLEPMPNYDSRVSLAVDNSGQFVTDELDVPRPRLDFVLDDYTQKGGQVFEQVADMIIERMSNGKQTKATIVDQWFGAGHVMGTHRMGDSAEKSVTDSFGRTWDHPNLYLTGSGLFPTVGSANPTLTIVAVTLRQAAHLIEKLRQHVSA